MGILVEYFQDVRRAVVFRTQLLQWDVVWHYRGTCRVGPYYTTVWIYFKATLMDFGDSSPLMCYRHVSFFNCRASDTVHNTATTTLKCPLSWNSSGLLYLTDAQESLSHQRNTSHPPMARDSAILILDFHVILCFLLSSQWSPALSHMRRF